MFVVAEIVSLQARCDESQTFMELVPATTSLLLTRCDPGILEFR